MRNIKEPFSVFPQKAVTSVLWSNLWAFVFRLNSSFGNFKEKINTVEPQCFFWVTLEEILQWFHFGLIPTSKKLLAKTRMIFILSSTSTQTTFSSILARLCLFHLRYQNMNNRTFQVNLRKYQSTFPPFSFYCKVLYYARHSCRK